MRYLYSILSTAIALSILGSSPVLGQAGPTNPDAPQAEPRSIASVSIPPLGSNYIEMEVKSAIRERSFIAPFRSSW